MKRTWWLLLFTLTLIIVVPGLVTARSEASGETALSQSLVGRKALRLGDRGPAVAALQRLLQERGFDPEKIDGVFGPLTERAVKQAQAALGLTRDGLAGVATTAALEAAETRIRPAVMQADLFHAVSSAPRVPSATLVLHQGAATEAPAVTAVQTPAVFALTFNGAPDPGLLPTILASLKAHGAKATFFVTADTIETAGAQLAQIAAAGHEIGLAGLPADAGLTERQLRLQLSRAQRAMKAAVGQEARYYRPAGGRVSDALVTATAGVGMELTLWTNVTVTDHAGLTPAELAERLEPAAYPGSVLMVHQDRPGTVAALEPLLSRLGERAVRSVALSDLARD